jgi:Spy/CpxP family protein refolding chaperone
MSNFMSRRLWPTFVFVILLLPGLALAQGPRGGGFPGAFGMQWWENPVANGLNLSEAQNKQIRSIVAEYRSKLIDLRANEEKAQGDFQDVFNDAPADQRRANDAIDRLGNARGEMTKVISQMSLKMRNVLTAEQWQQLRERQEGRMRNRMMPAPMDSKGGPRGDGRRGFRRGPDGGNPNVQPGPPPQAGATPPPPQVQPVKPPQR